MDNVDVLDPRTRANVNQVTVDCSYSEVTGGPAPQDVPLPAVVSNAENVMKITYADNELPRRPCSIFFKIAYQALNMQSLFQDISKIGISPSSVRCLQRVSEGAYVITFKDPEERRVFSEKSSFISRPQRETTTVFIYDAPFELPDKALKLRLQRYGEVLRIDRGRYSNCTHVEAGIRYVKMCIDDSIPSFIRFGRRLVRVSYHGQQRTCRRRNQPGHQAKDCHTKFCFNCERVGHEARIVLRRFFAVFVRIPPIWLSTAHVAGFLLAYPLKNIRMFPLVHKLLSLIHSLLKSLFLSLLPHWICLRSLRNLRLRLPLSLRLLLRLVHLHLYFCLLLKFLMAMSLMALMMIVLIWTLCLILHLLLIQRQLLMMNWLMVSSLMLIC